MATRFQCVSYNILANAYAKQERYPLVDPEVLNWEMRKFALERRAARFNADMLCLQEVGGDAYAFLEQSLRAKGYLGVYARKAQDKPDGCAVFFRQEQLQFKSSRTLYYHDGDGALDSGHLALILSFECEAGLLHVADTHLKWDRANRLQERHLGYRQIKELLAQYVRTDQPDEAWVVCGDFNAQPDSPLVQELLMHGLRDAYDGYEQNTCNPNRKSKRIDYLFHTANLSAVPGDLPPIEDLTPLPSETEPSDHLAIMAEFTFQ